jgi:hypothetical protein
MGVIERLKVTSLVEDVQSVLNDVLPKNVPIMVIKLSWQPIRTRGS